MNTTERTMFRFLLESHIQAKDIKSLDDLFQSEYEIVLDKLNNDEIDDVNDIRDAAEFIFSDYPTGFNHPDQPGDFISA